MKKDIRPGLDCETTSDNLRSLFSSYGDLILDKTTGKSKGYGSVIFKHVDGALLALCEPSKKIDGRVTVTQLAAAGNSHSNPNPTDVDVTLRKITWPTCPTTCPSTSS
ncbi:UBP1-associated protein 2C [Turnera subulata]|uniref:UBP1-associated protein 2C n=1 Tax=Turnera subulata TaxID=218843 RepID=A0A9Q0G171_9ROSI|nr:UBP1-associated protein 2C [Turnera subulata]